jgi:hypothetical protein
MPETEPKQDEIRELAERLASEVYAAYAPPLVDKLERIIRESEMARKAAAFDWITPRLRHIFCEVPKRKWHVYDGPLSDSHSERIGSGDTLLAAVEAAREGGDTK